MIHNVFFVSGVNSQELSQEEYREALEVHLQKYVEPCDLVKVYLFDPKSYFKRNWLEHLVSKFPLGDMTADVLQYMLRYRGNAASEVDRACWKEFRERKYAAVLGHSLGTVILARMLEQHACFDVVEQLVDGGRNATIHFWQSPLWMSFWRMFSIVDGTWALDARVSFSKQAWVYSSKDWISAQPCEEADKFNYFISDAKCPHNVKACIRYIEQTYPPIHGQPGASSGG